MVTFEKSSPGNGISGLLHLKNVGVEMVLGWICSHELFKTSWKGFTRHPLYFCFVSLDKVLPVRHGYSCATQHRAAEVHHPVAEGFEVKCTTGYVD